jgi:hypothetical protein
MYRFPSVDIPVHGPMNNHPPSLDLAVTSGVDHSISHRLLPTSSDEYRFPSIDINIDFQ